MIGIKERTIYLWIFDIDISRFHFHSARGQHCLQDWVSNFWSCSLLCTWGGGGGNLTCPWYGVAPFLGYLFHEGHFTPKKSRTPWAKNPFLFKKNPPKIRKNPFVVKECRTLFRKSEMPLIFS